MAFESGVMTEDWKSAMIVPLYKGKGERTKCKNYRGISLLSMVGKICGIKRVDRVSNAVIREICGCELSVLERIEKNVLK